MKKNVLAIIFAGVFITGSILTGCGTSDAQNTQDTAADLSENDSNAESDVSKTGGESETKENEASVLRVGYQPKFGDAFIALEEQNHFLENALQEIGVDLEFYEFSSGPELLQSMSSGGLDVGGFVGDTPFITSAAAGYSLVGICAQYNDDTKNTTVIVADEGSGIESIADLVGKKVAVSIGTNAHLFLVRALETEELTTDDIELVNLADTDFMAALEGDEVDAVITDQSLATTIESAGAGTQVDAPVIALGKAVFVANSDFAEANPEIVSIYLEALLYDYDYFENNRDEVQALTAERFDIPLESLATYQDVTFDLDFDDDFYERVQGTIDFLISQETIEDLDIKSVTDQTYLDRAKQLLEEQE